LFPFPPPTASSSSSSSSSYLAVVVVIAAEAARLAGIVLLVVGTIVGTQILLLLHGRSFSNGFGGTKTARIVRRAVVHHSPRRGAVSSTAATGMASASASAEKPVVARAAKRVTMILLVNFMLEMLVEIMLVGK
jgi:hypothetical protein